MKKIVFLSLLFLQSTGMLSAQQKDSTTTNAGSIKHDANGTLVEIEAMFPGGEGSWQKYLHENLVYPSKAVRKKVQGNVIMQFNIAQDGTVSNVVVIYGPELLRQPAIDVLKNSPKWKPATRNGKSAASMKRMPIVFKLEKKD